jgi:hypothetical protein
MNRTETILNKRVTTPQKVDLETTQVLAKNKQFLFLTKHQPCYWSSPGKVVSMLKERKHPHTSEMSFDKLIFRKGHPPCDDDLRIYGCLQIYFLWGRVAHLSVYWFVLCLVYSVACVSGFSNSWVCRHVFLSFIYNKHTSKLYYFIA